MSHSGIGTLLPGTSYLGETEMDSRRGYWYDTHGLVRYRFSRISISITDTRLVFKI